MAATGTLHAHSELPNGTPAEGTVVVTVNTTKQVIRDPAGNIVFQGPLSVKLIDGEATFTLPASDDATLEPTGFTYTVQEQLKHVSKSNYRNAEFALAGGTTVHLGDIASDEELADDPSYGASFAGIQGITDPVFAAALSVSYEDRVASFSVTDHGYTGSNLASDTAAVQALIATVADRTVTQSGAAGDIEQGCEIVFPEGTFVLDEITLDKVSLKIRGAGPGTVIKYGGAAGGTLFHVTNSQMVEFTDMTVLGDTATPPANLFWFDTTAAPYVGGDRGLAIRRCQIGRRYLTGSVTSDDGESGVGVRIGGATVANGDRWIIEDTTIYDCSSYGLYIAHEQAVWGKLNNVHFRSCDVGFHSEANLNARDVHFTYCGTDISVGTSCWVSVDGYNSEESDQLITMLASARLNIKHGKALLNAAAMNGATYWADCQVSNGGYLHLEDLWVSDETYSTGPKLHCAGSSGPLPATVHIHDCLLPNGDSDAGYDFDSTSTGTPMFVEVRQHTYYRQQVVTSANAVRPFATDANQLLGKVYDPVFAGIGQATAAAGVLYVARVHLPEGGSIANVLYHVTTAGTVLTSAQCLIGVYDEAGALIGQSADLSGVWNSIGAKTTPLVAPTAVQPVRSFVDIAWLWNGTTGPQLRGFNGSTVANIGISAASALNRFATAGSALTALPSTLPTKAAASTQPWIGVK